MNKKFLLLGVIVLFGVAVWSISGRDLAPARTPDEVVLHSIDCLRSADFSALRDCYSENAWAVVEGSLPDSTDSTAITQLKKYMSGVLGVRIEATTYRSEVAEVELLIERADGTEREIFQLIKSGDSWLIG
jgi:hypothetical protein